MGKLPAAAVEVRLAATLFLLLLGIADVFGAWEVRNFASFTPEGVAAAVAVSEHAAHVRESSREVPIDLSSLQEGPHHIDRELLVQDTHVHVPAYAMTAAFLALIVFGLRLTSRVRVLLVLVAFAAPFFDFAGLWGAHVAGAGRRFWGAVAVAGGALMGLVYLAVLVLALWQCWLRRQVRTEGEAHA